MTSSFTDVKALADIFEERSDTRFAHRIINDLEWDDFERFVAYVFERAGYTVQNTALQFGQGLDLKLYSSPDMKGKPVACVSVKQHKSSNPVGIGDVRDFQTAVQGAGIPLGFLVTNSSFTQPALNEAQNWPRLRLISGAFLRRFVVYVRGTRPPRSNMPAIAPDVFLAADATKIRATKQTKVLAVANNKGGVGKTTTALYLAKRIAEQEKARVLLVDFDSQLNLTLTLPPPSGNNVAPLSLAEYFSDERKLYELIRPTELQRVYLIPSHETLRVATAATSTDPQAELKFVTQLHATEMRPPHYLEAGDFDWIIIDTPPEMNFRTRAALAASHFVVAPTEPGAFETSGLQQLLDTVETMQGLIGRPIRILGCVFTKWKDDKTHQDSLQEFKQKILTPNGIRVFDTKIPLDTNVGKDEATQFRLPILSRKPAAKRYSELATEVINHANNG